MKLPFTFAQLKMFVTTVASWFGVVASYVNLGNLPTSVRDVVAAGSALIIAVEHAANKAAAATTSSTSTTPLP